MATIKLVELGPTQYLNNPPEFDPSGSQLCSVLFKYLIKKEKTVDNGNSNSNIKFTNCNTKFFTKAISVLVATTKLNTFSRLCAYG